MIEVTQMLDKLLGELPAALRLAASFNHGFGPIATKFDRTSQIGKG
jgi:hypothetical protein